MEGRLAIALASCLAAGCASLDDRSQPAPLQAQASAAQGRLVETVRCRPAYGRVLGKLEAGSLWRTVGTIPQGTVHAPVDGLVQIRSTHAHEAFLVVADGRLVGLFLPVERRFVAVKQPTAWKVEEVR